MDGIQFDAWTRQAGTVTRKVSLKLMGASIAAVVAARPLAGGAKKKKKPRGQTCATDCAEQCGTQCAAQVGPCEEYWTGFCDEDEECEEYFHGCCQFLATCDGSQYFACVDERE